MRKIILASVLASSAAWLCGCSTNPFTGEAQMSDTAIGAGAGAALGAGAGLAVGSVTHADKGTSALIGAGLGAVAGAGTGMYMDSQNNKKHQQMQASGVAVTRAGNSVSLSLDKEVSFASGDATLSGADCKTLDSVAMVLQKYPKTKLDVIGYADAHEGAEISKKRAEVVVTYLTAKGIPASRLQAVGTSAMMATASRRVELNLQPTG